MAHGNQYGAVYVACIKDSQLILSLPKRVVRTNCI